MTDSARTTDTPPPTVDLVTGRTVDDCQQRIGTIPPEPDDLHATFTPGPEGTAFEITGTLPRTLPRMGFRVAGTMTTGDEGTHITAALNKETQAALTARLAWMQRISQGGQGIMIAFLALSFLDPDTTLMMMVVNTIALAVVLYLHFAKVRIEEYLPQVMVRIAARCEDFEEG